MKEVNKKEGKRKRKEKRNIMRKKAKAYAGSNVGGHGTEASADAGDGEGTEGGLAEVFWFKHIKVKKIEKKLNRNKYLKVDNHEGS